MAFTIEPAAGPLPFLNPPSAPVGFGGAIPLGPQISLKGSGFSANTQIFWDGTSIPVTAFTATGVTITPPAADLAQWGQHQVYAASGAFQSAPVTVIVARSVNARGSAYDSANNVLYLLSGSTPQASASDLLILDGATGHLLNTLPALIPGSGPMAVSANGQYLYLASNAGSFSLAQVYRYSAMSGGIDLQWAVPSPTGQTFSQVNYLLTPPDSAQTVIVSSSNDSGDCQVVIFDGNQARALTSVTAGFPLSSYYTGYPTFFASSSRIYTGNLSESATATGDPCWQWFDYSALGITGGQPSCADAPSELKYDSGVDYLTDGTRVFVVAEPLPPQSGLSAPSPTADIINRRAWQLNVTPYSVSQVFAYDMNAQRLQWLMQVSYNTFQQTAVFYSLGNGSALLVAGSYVYLVH
jgi:hypothetical protein